MPLAVLQRAIVMLSGVWHRVRGARQEISWVVGPTETASMVANIAKAIPQAFSVNLVPHRFYGFTYDYVLESRRGDWLRRVVVLPWLFGRLASVAKGFVYI